MAYKHAYLDTLLLLHFTLTLNVVKISLKGEVGGHALNSHGNALLIMKIMEKSWNCVFNFCGNLVVKRLRCLCTEIKSDCIKF